MEVKTKEEDIIINTNTNTQVDAVQGNVASKQEHVTEADQTSDNRDGDDEIQKEDKKVDVADSKGEASPSDTSGKIDTFLGQTEENGVISDLKSHEKKALTEFKSRIEEAILMNKLFEKKKDQEDPVQNEQESNTSQEEKEKQSEDKGKAIVEDEHPNQAEIQENITLWGVPLLPSRGDAATDAILIKFLRARDFKVNDAFEMLRDTLIWRKENRVDSILEEDLGNEYDQMVYMSGVDREGHPVCFNLYGIFADNELYDRTFGTPESREKFLRWRLKSMEKEILNLDFRPGGVSQLLQINDLKDTPGFARKDIRLATRQAVALLENNYPEFVARNVFVNVPLWYYAFNAILTPFLTQRTKSKFDFARATRVTETLLKYISGEQIPLKYGGLKRENDHDFSTGDLVSEVPLRAGSIESVEIPAPKAGSTLVWDITVTGWEVNYKEEFVPTDEGSYAIIVKRGRWMGWFEEPVRNSFKNNEPGKVVITVENGIFKKKRILYRYKTRDSSPSNV